MKFFFHKIDEFNSLNIYIIIMSIEQIKLHLFIIKNTYAQVKF